MPASTELLNAIELGAWRGLLQAHSATVRALDLELEREHGLPLTSYEVLLQLHESETGSLRMGELAERILLSRSGLTRLIDRLARAGYVVREECESDRRGAFATITERGIRCFRQARPTHLRGVREHFLSKLDEPTMRALATAWERVLSDPDRTGAERSPTP